MKHRKYTCYICKAQVKKEDSVLVETPCDLGKYPKGIGRSRVCKIHKGIEVATIPEVEVVEGETTDLATKEITATLMGQLQKE